MPEDVSVLVEYKKPDGTEGVYDTMPDGTDAWTVDSGILTLALAPQMLTAPGAVDARVRLYRGDAVLSIFPFRLIVGKGVGEGAGSEDYQNWRGTFLPQVTGAKPGQWLRITRVDEAGRVLAAEACDGYSKEEIDAMFAAYLGGGQ